MALREQILEKQRWKAASSGSLTVSSASKPHGGPVEDWVDLVVPTLPVNEEDEEVIDNLMRSRRPEADKRKLWGPEDSQRLIRVERMLVAILKKLDL